MVGPIEKELLKKETVIEELERMRFDQASMIKELEAELEVFQREAEEEEQTGIFGVKAERVDNKSDKTRAMELEAQIFEAERARSIQSLRENMLEAKITEAEERGWRDEIEGEE